MKKDYLKPVMQAVNISIRHQILAGSPYPVSRVSGNAEFNENITGGSGNARSRNFNDWNDEE
jgi:hypothetical protein